MIYTAHVVDDIGRHHGWTIEGRDTHEEALAVADRVLSEDHRGRTRVSAEVFESRVDGQPVGPAVRFGAAPR